MSEYLKIQHVKILCYKVRVRLCRHGRWGSKRHHADFPPAVADKCLLAASRSQWEMPKA